MESKVRSCLTVVFAVVVLALIAYNLYTGATIQEIGIPGLFTIKFGEKSASGPGSGAGPAPSSIVGAYRVANQPGRMVNITPDGGPNYRVEESPSPAPWEGPANFDGKKLVGDAKFMKTLATMHFEGSLRGDGAIELEYRFLTNDDGSPAGGRVEPHVWFPAK